MLFITGDCFAQKISSDVNLDTAKVELTQWQSSQVERFQKELQTIKEQYEKVNSQYLILIMAICDFNKIDQSKVRDFKSDSKTLSLIISK